MMTVKMGAELFTVSAKDTATFFRLTRPSTTVVNLEGEGGGGAVHDQPMGGQNRPCLNAHQTSVSNNQPKIKKS